MRIIEDDKSSVISLTVFRLERSIFLRIWMMSSALVPLTTATKVPFLPFPALLVRKV